MSMLQSRCRKPSAKLGVAMKQPERQISIPCQDKVHVHGSGTSSSWLGIVSLLSSCTSEIDVKWPIEYFDLNCSMMVNTVDWGVGYILAVKGGRELARAALSAFGRVSGDQTSDHPDQHPYRLKAQAALRRVTPSPTHACPPVIHWTRMYPTIPTKYNTRVDRSLT